MRLLAIDIGNTSISCGIFDQERLSSSFSISTKECNNLFEKVSDEVQGVCISSVVPSVNQLVIDKIKGLGISPRFVSPLDLETDLLSPSEIGQDRIANGVAARNLYQLPVIVVDFGTATTFDVIGKDGVYLGGAILPGIETSFSALIERCELLSNIELKPPKVCIGKDTEQALLSGVFYGFSAQVDGMVRRIKAELGPSAKVIGTGGNSGLISNFCSEIDEINPHLTLYGLMWVYKHKK
jgi:type III pantothenate kinase